MKRKNQELLGRAAARRAGEVADAANAAGSVAPNTPSPQGPESTGAAPELEPALVIAVRLVAGELGSMRRTQQASTEALWAEVKALREALVQVGFALTAGAQVRPPPAAVPSSAPPAGPPSESASVPAEAEPPENAFTIQMARQAVLTYAAKAGAPKAGALLRERVGAAKVSDLKTPEQFAKVVEVFRAELRDLEVPKGTA